MNGPKYTSYSARVTFTRKVEAPSSPAPSDPDGLLREALKAHQGGLLDQAERFYRAVLDARPEDFNALTNLGTVFLQRGRTDEGMGMIERSLAVKPEQPNALNNLGTVLVDLRRFDRALEVLDRSIALDPGNADAFSNRGNALRDLGRSAEAIESYDRAIALKPDFTTALRNRGNLMKAEKRHAEAQADYLGALALEPDHQDTQFSHGETLLALGRHGEAETVFRRLAQVRPGHAESLWNLGVALAGLERPQEALAAYEQFARLRPDAKELDYNRGNAFNALRRFDEALAAYDRAVELDPGLALGWANRATVLQGFMRLEEAMQSLERALAIDPEHALANWNYALMLILIGRYAEGWRLYEWRWRQDDAEARPEGLEGEAWLGEGPVEGKTLLLYCEQGLGDSIQMLRYVPLLAARGARVALNIQPSLAELARGLAGVAEVTVRGDTLPSHDLHCPLMSLPLAMGTTLRTVPWEGPYLSAPASAAEAWKARLGPRRRPRVGLTWSGNPGHKNDFNRSLPLETLAPILDLDADFISLQKEPREADLAALRAGGRVLDVADGLASFADTAGLVAQLDLVVSVDTSVAHLTGAMGRPLLLLLPFASEYRWGASGETTPWYPTARLLRQPSRGDWSAVLPRIAEAIGHLA